MTKISLIECERIAVKKFKTFSSSLHWILKLRKYIIFEMTAEMAMNFICSHE